MPRDFMEEMCELAGVPVHESEQPDVLDEAVGKKDKAVIRAFLDRKAMEGTKLTTDGKSLDGMWMGGRGIAIWNPKGDGKGIILNELGSKAAQSVQRALRKVAPKAWIIEDEEPVDPEEAAVIERFAELAGLDPIEEAKKKSFKKGDIVRHTKKFLRNTGQYTGNPSKGEVVGFIKMGGKDLPTVKWDDGNEHPIQPENIELHPRYKGKSEDEEPEGDELSEGKKKTYVVNVTEYFRGIGDRGAVVQASSEKEAIAKAAKQMRKKPNYLEVVGVYEDVDVIDDELGEAKDPRIKKAEELGRKAFEDGKKAIPAHDKKLNALMKGEKIGGAGVAIMKAWHRGWTKANLAADTNEEIDLDEAKAVGKAQKAIMDAVQQGPMPLTVLAARAPLSTMHFGKVMSGAEALAKKGLIKLASSTNEGLVVSPLGEGVEMDETVKEYTGWGEGYRDHSKDKGFFDESRAGGLYYARVQKDLQSPTKEKVVKKAFADRWRKKYPKPVKDQAEYNERFDAGAPLAIWFIPKPYTQHKSDITDSPKQFTPVFEIAQGALKADWR